MTGLSVTVNADGKMSEIAEVKLTHLGRGQISRQSPVNGGQ